MKILKSNMDRFIELPLELKSRFASLLKSNMDRFIGEKAMSFRSV